MWLKFEIVEGRKLLWPKFEIVEGRKLLWPKFSEANRIGLRATLVFDKLYMEGSQWYSDSEQRDRQSASNPYTRAGNQSSTIGSVCVCVGGGGGITVNVPIST